MSLCPQCQTRKLIAGREVCATCLKPKPLRTYAPRVLRLPEDKEKLKRLSSADNLTAKRLSTSLKLRLGCACCGYKRCAQALHWHHRQQDLKTMCISRMTNVPRVLEEILEHDVVVLCAVCHVEVEKGLRRLPKRLPSLYLTQDGQITKSPGWLPPDEKAKNQEAEEGLPDYPEPPSATNPETAVL